MNQPAITVANERRELTSFWAGDQEYCVDIMSVREIRGWSAATPLPQSPSYMRGVINLRGAVLPIMDLAERLDLPPTEPSERSVIIVVQVGERLVGLLVDAVSDILSINPEQIQPTPDVGCDQAKAFVRGLITIDDRMVSEIAVERLLPELEGLAA
ncbi:MAG: chemotaxis protein CheW [Phenylobacterium sp.]|jgi:purine-binding chemotaxis protein CheW|uniref:chemotaxis protein CheW n=1 Tax=Phenylobacterium sp. TaxID=1871053 RepID=UPI0025F8A689|nr:chemotaxis protein CheW [Phenylobacterium sp.]MCA3573774.1 chemotaxis protein CheW [Aestuariivirga sp.]MCA3699796.1 chemotaxis protein CheW [Brevundimonas sp.]MCA6299994.1 chemotaxis protein CheW [Phenylobacterium sp.]